MKVLRSRILVTLVLAAIALALGSGAALASLRSSSPGTTIAGGSVVTLGDRPAAPSDGEPDIGGYKPPAAKGLRPVYPGSPYGSWWTWISRIWASWIGRGVR